MPRRSTPLTRERLVSTALRIVDEQGFSALTMRRLATELGVDPMAAYYHVPDGKPGLVRLLVQHILGALELPALDGTWQAQVLHWAHAYREVTLAHPNLVFQIVSDVEALGDAATRANESLYAALELAELPPGAIAQGAGLLVDFIHGYCLGAAAGSVGEGRDSVRDTLQSLPASQYPVQHRVLAAAGGTDSATYFDFGVRTIIAGLTALIPPAAECLTGRRTIGASNRKLQ